MSKGDDKLNPLSKDFDPLAALYSESDIDLPVPDAPILDNLSRVKETAEGIIIKTVRPKKVEPVPVAVVLPPRELGELPAPSTSTEVKPAGKRSVVTFMETAEGPLAKLRDCMERGARIKVTTRSAVGVRGTAEGSLAAFDKMWNLAMEDVTEVWIRKRKKKSVPLGPSEGTPQWRVFPPRISVTPIDLKRERCTRHVPKLLMRGEHVVHIQVLQ